MKKESLIKKMEKCKNCKYFIKNANNEIKRPLGKNEIRPSEPDFSKVGNCKCPKFIKGYYDEQDCYNETNLINLKKDEVLVEYKEEWGFIVGEEFGCIHFKDNKQEIPRL